MRTTCAARLWVLSSLLAALAGPGALPPALGAVTRDEVERAIREGVRFLEHEQRPDGSWSEIDHGGDATSLGTTGLVTLALLAAGEPVGSEAIQGSLGLLRRVPPERLNSTYSVALQALAFAAAEPDRDRMKLVRDVEWLERAQIRPGDARPWPGSWSYTMQKTQPGDNSNSQYALLGLSAASEAGVPVRPVVWALARRYWESAQRHDGGWAYKPDLNPATGSMTCAGISSLIITGTKRFQRQESLAGDQIRNCGKGGVNPDLLRGIDWMGRNFAVRQNPNSGQQWRYYYLYGLERAGRLTGLRCFGRHDWYREGAEELVHDQDRLSGSWRSNGENKLVATSFALLFLAKGRAPVLVNKLRHGPQNDWDNDPDDIRNLVALSSRDWKSLLTWQVVDPGTAAVEDLLQAPIAFLNGHEDPDLSPAAKKALRDYIEQGGFLLAEACCGRPEFDRGFRALMKELFPEPEYNLHPLAEDHAIWRAKHRLLPDIHPLWGIEYGCRTVVVYSPSDLSCYWNQSDAAPANPAVIKALKVGQNIVDYATGRELPADKLVKRSVNDLRPESPRRGALRIAKLRHAGDWNVAPLAVPSLMAALRQPPLSFDVVLSPKELFPQDAELAHYPLLYIHGRAALSFSEEDLAALRRHLEPGGGTLFADAACGSPAFDAAFRKVAAALVPGHTLEAIPPEDDIYSKKTGFDLSQVQYSKAAGGGRGFPQLEGIKLNGRWAVIYSKYDIGCALEKHQGLDCKGYAYESALRIAANVVIYSTLP